MTSLLLPSTDDASARLSSFNEAAPLGLKISWAKNRLHNVGSGPAPNRISVDSSNIESVENFTYLGSLQSSNGCCSQDLKRRAGLASSVMASLHRIWKDQRLSLTTKLQVYEALVLSVLIYAGENWTLLATETKSLEAFHMKCQPQVLGIRWFDFVSNVDVQARTGLTPLGEILAARRMLVWTHCSAESDVSVHLALCRHIDLSVGRPPGLHWRRRPGRPRVRWIDQI